MPSETQNIDPDLVRQYEKATKPTGTLTNDLRRVCGPAAFLIELYKASETSPDPTLASPSLVLWYEKGNEKQRIALEKFIGECGWVQETLIRYSAQCYIIEGLPAKLSALTSRELLQQMQTADCSITVSRHRSSLCGAPVANQGGHRQTFGGWLLVDGHQAFGLTTRHGFDRINEYTKTSGGSPSSSSSEALDTHLEKEVDYPNSDKSVSSVSSVVSYNVSATAYYPASQEAIKVSAEPLELDWDWALLEIHEKPELMQKAEILKVDSGSLFSKGDYRNSVQPFGCVTIQIAGNELCQGNLSASKASFFIQSSLYDVRLIILDQILPPGSSGTWVDFDGYVCGVIVAARQDMPWAYMIPIGSILDDIKAAMGTEDVKIPAADEWLSFYGVNVYRPPSGDIVMDPLTDVAPSASATDIMPSADAPTAQFSTTQHASQLGLRPAAVSSILRRLNLLRKGRKRVDHKAMDAQTTSAQAKIGRDAERGGKESAFVAETSTIEAGMALQPQGIGPATDIPGSELSQKYMQVDHPLPRLHPNLFISTDKNPAQEQLLPDVIPCTLVVTYDHMPVGEPQRIPVRWNFPSSFQSLEKAAQRGLRSDRKDSASQLYMKSGRCCLINDRIKKQHTSKVLEFQKEWPETVANMVTSFWSQHPDDEFHLEVQWGFSGLEIHHKEDETYAETIRGVIQGKMRQNWEQRMYIPRRDLNAIMSQATIRELVSQDSSLWTPKFEAQSDDCDLDKGSFVKKVTRLACKLLAICIYVDLPLVCLHKLLCSGIEDIDLPLKNVPCPMPRHETKWNYLLMVQGGFIAHTFDHNDGRLDHHEIEKQIVVPIAFNGQIGEGGFGEVFEVSIDSDHHFFSSDKDERFALKRFFDEGSRRRSDFEKESKMLSALSRMPHKSITQHLAVWTQDNRYYMLFPRAETNLRNFMNETSPPTLNKDTVLWLLKQIKGIADAVRQIHNLGSPGLGSAFLERGLDLANKCERTSFHHDLRPENILVFADNDASVEDTSTSHTWKISGFGSARIGTLLSGSDMQDESYFTNNLSHGDAVYGAPDFLLEGKTSRPYDMWSLGCVFLECLLWVLGTPGSGLLAFAAERLKMNDPKAIHQDSVFWDMGSDGKVRLKPAVVTKLKDLRQDCEGRGVLKLLVISIGKLLTIRPRERMDAPNLVNELDAILTQAEIDLDDDPNYYMSKDFSRPRKIGQVAAPPSTPSEGNGHSIDERSIDAPHGRHLISHSQSLIPYSQHSLSSNRGRTSNRRSRPSDSTDYARPMTPINHPRMLNISNRLKSLSTIQK